MVIGSTLGGSCNTFTWELHRRINLVAGRLGVNRNRFLMQYFGNNLIREILPVSFLIVTKVMIKTGKGFVTNA